MPNRENLNPYMLGHGNLSPEEETRIRSEGGKACARKKRERRTQAETLRRWMYENLKDDNMIGEAEALGFGEDGQANGMEWLTARIIGNEARKGTVDALRTIADLIGETGDTMKEDSFAAFVDALKQSDDA